MIILDTAAVNTIDKNHGVEILVRITYFGFWIFPVARLFVSKAIEKPNDD